MERSLWSTIRQALLALILLLGGLLLTERLLPAPDLLKRARSEEGSGMDEQKDTLTIESTGANRLRFEQSPYLLQHKDNPVDWYPWVEEAFRQAESEDLPLMLSVGYSTCHWCHVMERESFEDSEVATLLNEGFVCIKVDREERPDIDHLYMNVTQMMTGRGGWPMTVFMTPGGEPFYAATYLPKHGRSGLPGMMELLPRISELWRNQRHRLTATAGRVGQALEQLDRISGVAGLPGEAELDRGLDVLRRSFDREHGGFGGRPKFPVPHNFLFLLRQWQRSGDPETLAMVERGLRALRRGGIFDQLGFGFHRYSTDERWFAPHFEKMLYDQALLALAYAECHQATGSDFYARVLREILEYVLHDLASPEGAFYSAEDADSEGEEGRFYVWQLAEVRELLGTEDAALAARVFGLKEDGNWPEGRGNILCLERGFASAASEAGLAQGDFDGRYESIRRRMLSHRAGRVRPGLDDKVLCDWNGLMIAALARAGAVLEDETYTAAARRCARFLLERLRDAEGRLLHSYRGGKAAVRAHLDDYAFLIWGLIELHQADFDPAWLEAALELQTEQHAHFWDEEQGGYYLGADDGESLIARLKETHDGALPAGNSVALQNLQRLAHLSGDPLLFQRADSLARALKTLKESSDGDGSQYLCAVDFLAGPSREVVLCGPLEREDTRILLAELRGRYLPRTVILLRPEDADLRARIDALAPFSSGQGMLGDRAAAYVCENFSCLRPATSPRELASQLGR